MPTLPRTRRRHGTPGNFRRVLQMVGVEGDKRITPIGLVPEGSEAGTKDNTRKGLSEGMDKDAKDSRRSIQEIQARKNPAHSAQVAGT